MKINIIGRNIEITPALKTFVTDKMARIEKRDSSVRDMHVILQVENLTHTAEATFLFHGSEIHAKAKNSDMYVAIDELVDKLMAQITKIKDKSTDHR